MRTGADVPFHAEHPYEPPYDREAHKRIADLEAELEASKGRERLWQGRSNVMREEMQKSEAENTRLKMDLERVRQYSLCMEGLTVRAFIDGVQCLECGMGAEHAAALEVK